MELVRCLLLLTISVLCTLRCTSASCLGCVDLDGLTFYKLIPRFPYALVKFDIAFPYGEKHEAFGQFVLKAHQGTDDLLTGLVGIKDYGEKENNELGLKFNIEADAYPAIFLFRGNGIKDYVRFPSDRDITVENLKEFVTENSDLYIGLDGCLKEFNELVIGYVDKSKADQRILIEKASKLLENGTDDSQKASAKVYIAFMTKILEEGFGFVNKETARLMKLKMAKINESKKTELSLKLNILQSFKSKGSGSTKSEL